MSLPVAACKSTQERSSRFSASRGRPCRSAESDVARSGQAAAPSGVLDTDGDGAPSVTLHPNVSPQRMVHAVRTFDAQVTPGGSEGKAAFGFAAVRAEEVVLGGYASGSVAGRVRADSTEADPLCVPVDDTNRDDAVTFFAGRAFGALPPLLADTCERGGRV